MKKLKQFWLWLESLSLKVALLLLAAAMFWATGGVLLFKAYGPAKLIGAAMLVAGLVYSRRLIITNNKIK